MQSSKYKVGVQQIQITTHLPVAEVVVSKLSASVASAVAVADSVSAAVATAAADATVAAVTGIAAVAVVVAAMLPDYCCWLSNTAAVVVDVEPSVAAVAVNHAQQTVVELAVVSKISVAAVAETTDVVVTVAAA